MSEYAATPANFPAPTVASNDAPAYNAPQPLEDAARTTSERARTLGLAVPSDHAQAPALTQATPEAPAERTLTMPFAGHDFIVYPERFTGEAVELQEQGKITEFCKRMIGVDQWNVVKTWHARDLRFFLEALNNVDLMGK